MTCALCKTLCGPLRYVEASRLWVGLSHLPAPYRRGGERRTNPNARARRERRSGTDRRVPVTVFRGKVWS